MFTVSDPEKSHIPSVTARTLGSALLIKLHWKEWLGLHAIIVDKDGCVVSLREQEQYLLRR